MIEKMRCRMLLPRLLHDLLLDLVDVVVDARQHGEEGGGHRIEDLVDEELFAAQRMLVVASAQVLERPQRATVDRHHEVPGDDHVEFAEQRPPELVPGSTPYATRKM